MKLERDFQLNLIKELRELFPGCIILKNDSSYMQGVPDLIILWQDKWAMLEVKRNKNSDAEPNQPYYVEVLNRMSYASFIYPENKKEVLDEIQRQFKTGRKARTSQRK